MSVEVTHKYTTIQEYLAKHKKSPSDIPVNNTPLGVMVEREVTTNNSLISIPSPPPTADDALIERVLQGDGRRLDEYQALKFAHPLELAAFIDDNIIARRLSYHPWQVETSQVFGLPCFTKENPLHLYIRAANGSGKDAYVNAPLGLFVLLCKVRSRCIITSASYNQLKTQTQTYLSYLCHSANKKLAQQGICERALIIKKDHIVSTITGSEVVMFVTDEPGKAEGFHPFPDNPDGWVVIVTNEAKSIPLEIFESLSRCTYTHFVGISSPGPPSGFFYDRITSPSTVHHPEPLNAKKKYTRKITSYDCPHIARAKIEADKEDWGENSPIFRSKHLAEFTSLEESIVITPEEVDRCLERATTKYNLGLPRRAGLDLSAGGDENALYVFDNNECIGRETFISKDTSGITAKNLAHLFAKYELSEENIWGDDGGVGHSIIDDLATHHDYKINRVCNQWGAMYSLEFGNRGAELWFSFARLIQKCYIILPKDDKKLHKQLGSRYYTYSEKGKFILESKEKARAKGRKSPDRADAVVLAFCGLTIKEFRKVLDAKEVKRERFTEEQIIDKFEESQDFLQNRDNFNSINPARLHRHILCKKTF